MWILIGMLVLAGVVLAVESGRKLAKQQLAENATFMGEHRGWDIYASPHDRGVLALNHETKRIVVGKVTNYVERAWSDLSAVEIQKNGQSIQQTNRGSQAVGAAVGALLLGPVGLLVGGVTGSKQQRERISELSLKVTIDDREAPVHQIIFFRMAGNGTDANSILLKSPAAKMEHFHALLSNAIRSSYRQTFAPQAQIVGDPEVRVGKLWELRQAGAITDAEYASQKAAILSPVSTARIGFAE